MSKLTKAEQEEHWRRHIECQGSSGISARAYCRANGISDSAFSYWRRKLSPTTY